MRILCQVVVFFTFLTKDNNFKQFVVAHTVMHKYSFKLNSENILSGCYCLYVVDERR